MVPGEQCRTPRCPLHDLHPVRDAQGLHGAALPRPPRSGPLRRRRHVRLWVTATRRLWRCQLAPPPPRSRVARRPHLRVLLKGRKWGG